MPKPTPHPSSCTCEKCMRPVIWMHDKVAAIYNRELCAHRQMIHANSDAFEAGRQYGLGLRRVRSRYRARRCEHARILANTLTIFGPYAGAVLAPSQPEHENNPASPAARGARGGSHTAQRETGLSGEASAERGGHLVCGPHPLKESAPPVA